MGRLREWLDGIAGLWRRFYRWHLRRRLYDVGHGPGCLCPGCRRARAEIEAW